MQCIQVAIIFHRHLVTVQPVVNCSRFIFSAIDCVGPSCLQVPGCISSELQQEVQKEQTRVVPSNLVFILKLFSYFPISGEINCQKIICLWTQGISCRTKGTAYKCHFPVAQSTRCHRELGSRHWMQMKTSGIGRTDVLGKVGAASRVPKANLSWNPVVKMLTCILVRIPITSRKDSFCFLKSTENGKYYSEGLGHSSLQIHEQFLYLRHRD